LDSIEKIRSIVKEAMGEMDHDYLHVLRVEALALTIAGSFPQARLTILRLGALLHDIGRKSSGSTHEDHATIGARMAEEILKGLEMDSETIDAVCGMIRTHRYRKGPAPVSLEEKILYDADKIDALGAYGIVRTIAYALKDSQPMHMDLTKAKKQGLHPANREYHEKLIHLPELLYLEPSKALALGRMQLMEDFFTGLARETIV